MAGRNGIEVIKQITKRLQGSNAFDRTLNKVDIVLAENGKCQAEFTVGAEHQNLGGTLHGGFSATLVDCISTYALMTTGKQVPGVSVDLHVNYLKAAYEGEVVVVDAHTVKTGQNVAFLEVTLKNKKTGELIARGSHTKFIGFK